MRPSGLTVADEAQDRSEFVFPLPLQGFRCEEFRASGTVAQHAMASETLQSISSVSAGAIADLLALAPTECRKEVTIGALITTYTTLGVPYFHCSILDPKTRF